MRYKYVLNVKTKDDLSWQDFTTLFLDICKTFNREISHHRTVTISKEHKPNTFQVREEIEMEELDIDRTPPYMSLLISMKTLGRLGEVKSIKDISLAIQEEGEK